MLQRKVSTLPQHIAENSEMEITNLHILMFRVTHQGRSNVRRNARSARQLVDTDYAALGTATAAYAEAPSRTSVAGLFLPPIAEASAD